MSELWAIEGRAVSQGDTGGLEPRGQVRKSLAHLAALCGDLLLFGFSTCSSEKFSGGS